MAPATELPALGAMGSAVICELISRDPRPCQPAAKAGEIPDPGGLPEGGDLKDGPEIGLWWQENIPIRVPRQV